MSKFNAVVLTAADGTQVHFVTRGRAKPPEMDEIMAYFEENNITLADLEAEAKAAEDWRPPNERVFLTDLRSGLLFCSNKYGVDETTIETYVRNMAPHINLNVYSRGNKNG